MSFRDRMLEAMTERLAAKDFISGFGYYTLGDRKVVDFSEKTQYHGGCETCAWEEIVIEYTFDDETSLTETTSLAALMQEL